MKNILSIELDYCECGDRFHWAILSPYKLMMKGKTSFGRYWYQPGTHPAIPQQDKWRDLLEERSWPYDGSKINGQGLKPHDCMHLPFACPASDQCGAYHRQPGARHGRLFRRQGRVGAVIPGR